MPMQIHFEQGRIIGAGEEICSLPRLYYAAAASSGDPAFCLASARADLRPCAGRTQRAHKLPSVCGVFTVAS